MNTLWYKTPASDWNTALPVGNGRLGAMVFGNIGHEVIQLNEESIWSGPYKDRNNSSCLSYLKEVRNLISAGKLSEAQELAYETMSGTPPNEAVYQTAGELQIHFYTDETRGLQGPLPDSNKSFENNTCYRRELDLETAVATTSFSVETAVPSTADFAEHTNGSSITYTREVFASAAADILVVHISASLPKSIYFRATLNRGLWVSKNYAVCDDTIALQDTHGIPFCVMATAVASGGTVCTRGASLVVEGADDATIYVDIQSAFRNKYYARKGGNVGHLDHYAQWSADRALRNICLATGAPYIQLKEDHFIEYSHLYKKCALNLVSEETEDCAKLPTDELLKQTESKALAELYWNFSRYLLISCSRKPGTLPATLQGLWCKDMDPPWGSKYTININTEMNYWPANMCSISNTELPLFSLLARAYKNGKKTARTMYGCDGYVAHHNMDSWGDTAPQDEWLPGTYWVLGAAWMATHVREHYEYTMDKKFLKKNYYLLRDACRFFADYLVPSEDGKSLILFPSVSPENTYRLPNGKTGSFCAGCEMDNRILEHLFTATIQSAQDIGIRDDSADVVQFRSIRQKLIPPVVTAENTIREWNADYEETELGHRHISQLYGLFPGHTITVTRTPALAEAAHNTIEKRLANGGGHTGWSQAWIMNFRASLHESDAAYKSLTSLFAKSTLPNLLDNHPPFQIDGNFGALTAMTRMIVQCEMVDGQIEINLLPALPNAWSTGSLKGVSLKGNIKLDMEWKNNQITGGKLYTKDGRNFLENIVVCYQGKRYDARLVDGALEVMNVLPTTV